MRPLVQNRIYGYNDRLGNYKNLSEEDNKQRLLNWTKEFLSKELESHYEVLSEAIQTVLRKNKVDNAYELLKELSRGKKVTKKDIEEFVSKLDINEEDKKVLLNLTPSDYIGLCEIVVDNN